MTAGRPVGTQRRTAREGENSCETGIEAAPQGDDVPASHRPPISPVPFLPNDAGHQEAAVPKRDVTGRHSSNPLKNRRCRVAPRKDGVSGCLYLFSPNIP